MCIFRKLNQSKDTVEEQQVISESIVIEEPDNETLVLPKQIESKYKDVLVFLDNGHAKSTAGKRSPYALYKVEPALDFYEWKFNRIIVHKIEDRLKEYGIESFIVTPEEDEDVNLTTRYKRANSEKLKRSNKKCLLISVHANANGYGKEWDKARGWSCYTTKGQNNSDKFATCLYEVAEELLPKYGMTIRKDMQDGDPDYEENFTIIYGANMPAILTENLFYTNIKDTEFLLSEEGQNVITEIHVQGILRYCHKYLNIG